MCSLVQFTTQQLLGIFLLFANRQKKDAAAPKTKSMESNELFSHPGLVRLNFTLSLLRKPYSGVMFPQKATGLFGYNDVCMFTHFNSPAI